MKVSNKPRDLILVTTSPVFSSTSSGAQSDTLAYLGSLSQDGSLNARIFREKRSPLPNPS